MYATFERFEIKLTKTQATKGSHQGACDEDIAELLTFPGIKKQFEKIPADKIRDELKEYGAWDDGELSDDEQNLARILWIACGDINEELYERSKS